MVDKTEFGANLLSNSPLFHGLGDGEIGGLLERAQVHQFEDGDIVVEEGSQGDAIYLLTDGVLLVGTKDGQGRSVELAKLDQSGAFFGEIVLVDPGPRSATVRSSGQSVLLSLSLDVLNDFFAVFSGSEAAVLRNIARVLARRLRDSNALVSSLSSS